MEYSVKRGNLDAKYSLYVITVNKRAFSNRICSDSIEVSLIKEAVQNHMATKPTNMHDYLEKFCELDERVNKIMLQIESNRRTIKLFSDKYSSDPTKYGIKNEFHGFDDLLESATQMLTTLAELKSVTSKYVAKYRSKYCKEKDSSLKKIKSIIKSKFEK